MFTVSQKLTLPERIALAADVAQTLVGTVDGFCESAPEGSRARLLVRKLVRDLRLEATRSKSHRAEMR